jgi:sugar-phosphatase
MLAHQDLHALPFAGCTRPEMTEIRCRGVLFDLDGVLIDSTPAVTRVWRKWALEHGFDPAEVVARVHGQPSLATVREYLPNADHAAENREIERREMQDAEGIITLPGARELLLQLPAERWTIATSCTRSLAEVRLRAAALPIPERIVTSTDVTQGKPHPEPFLKAAAKLGFPASECVVVEDVPAGIRAGKAAGAIVIAFRTTVEEAELRSAGADFVLNNCSDVDVVHNRGIDLNSQRHQRRKLTSLRSTVCRKICSRLLTKFRPKRKPRRCVAEIF